VALSLLGVAVALAIWRRFETEGFAVKWRLVAVAGMLTGLIVPFAPTAHWLHEIWASLFIALSLAIYVPGRWGISVALGLLACFFRELALPYLFVMGAFASVERRWREVAAWTGASLLFLLAFGLHLSFASAVTHPGDIASPGWVRFGGLPFVIDTARRNPVLFHLPNPALALLVGLALIGFAGTRHAVAIRCGVLVGGYIAGLLVFGRPDNGYWGLLYAPLLPLGWIFAPVAMRDLARAAMGGSGLAVDSATVAAEQ
jgi:hypothetical protein